MPRPGAGSRARSDHAPGTGATLLLGAAGVAGVLVGATLDAGLGTAVMAVSAAVPPAVRGGALARTRTAVADVTRHRHRLAGDVAVADEQMRRLADRIDRLADQGVDDAFELERTRRQLRRARVELAGSRVALAGATEDAARARVAVDAAATALRMERTRADLAVAEAAQLASEADELAHAAVVAGVDGAPAAALWRPAARVVGQRSFASVDLRVFDAFTETDLADEDAVLDAPVRRGRHSAPIDLIHDVKRVQHAAQHEVRPHPLPAARRSDVA